MIIVACGWLAFMIFGQVVHGADLNARIRNLASQNDALRQQISDRQQEISQAQSPAWLEEEARMLGYVKPGEKVYVLATPGSHVPASGGVNASLPSFSPSPSPSPSPTAPGATPTPYTFSLTSQPSR